MHLTLHKNSYIFLAILLIIYYFFYAFFGEITPANEGLGWDGVTYADYINSFRDHFVNRNFSIYYAHRLLPLILVKLVHFVFNESISIVKIFTIFSIINLTAAIILWKKICKVSKFNNLQSLVGLLFIFLNFQFMKSVFYAPVVIDSFILILSLFVLYSYLTANLISLFILLILSSFVWQAGVLCCVLAIISLLGNLDFKNYYFKIDYVKIISIFLICVLALFFINFFRVQALNFFNQQVISEIKAIFIHTDIGVNKINANNLLLKIEQFITGLPTLYLFTSFFLYNINFCRLNFKFSNKTYSAFLSILSIFSILVILHLFCLSISDPLLIKGNLPGQDHPKGVTLQYLIQWILFPLGQPGTFFMPLLTDTLLLGPGVLISLLYWNKSIQYLEPKKWGIFLIVFVSLPLTLPSEPRFFLMAFPFLIYILISNEGIFEKKSFGKMFILTFLIATIFSRIYIKINYTMWNGSDDSVSLLFDFPRQLYFMIYGPWMSFEMYLLQLIVVICLIYFYFKFLSAK
jgi:hypothetical protein